MAYTFTDHLHNYAVWTAARAVQRNFTDTSNIKASIEQIGLKGLVNSKENITLEEFDNFHREAANKIIKFLESIGVRASYGQAAKIIAIYLKTSIVIRDSGLSTISKIVHPPIDSILLKGLHKKYPHLGVFGIRWTQLDETNYFNLINKLRTLNLVFFWEIEEHWTPIQNE